MQISALTKKKAKKSFNVDEREENFRGISACLSMRAIKSKLNHQPSTACREINRNCGYNKYPAVPVDKVLWNRAERPKICKLILNKKLPFVLARKLKCVWPPQQIVD
jgi:IS30 family transposase